MRAILARTLLFFLQSRLRVWGATIGAAVLFGLFEFAVSRWLIGVHLTANLHSALQAAIVGMGAGLSLWLIFLGIIDRRRIVADELRRVAELNHSVRNSLELIVLAHHSETDLEHKAMMLECTNQIDRTLRELYPVIAKTGTRKRIVESKRGKIESEGPGRTRAS